MPPGSTEPSSLAATLIPSPKMSSSSTTPRVPRSRSATRDDAGELDQHAVGGGFDDPSAMLGDLGIDQFTAMSLQTCEGSFFVV